MRKDDKRRFREEKRDRKKQGNKRKRLHLKKTLNENPDEAHLEDNENFNYGKFKTEDFKYNNGFYE